MVNENIHSEEGFTAQEQEAYANAKDFFPHPRDYDGPLGIFEDFEYYQDQVLNIPEDKEINDDDILNTIDPSWGDW